ncbi:CRISPR-associated CARF protein Csa3 [Sulfurisphaera ohwakuensis]|uniref:CRISPR locus-related DNA-binding protein n=1 Tax=Sulfurisphaera ohwakuensis TaxID=69656 RepID=A0A650CFJ8_SULOH|nr:CRISPR-associated CARF protein Csa3 [Sulfurisphaera ohwakuensis]MBB5254135.1 CRISPR-associated protein Csa3 [Sulfurisphaera ohwakuensis]QGR16516.1 CRISPR locus-related DNA-binding protein [Sulfurisphaera ohwakuensis]
MILVVTLGFDEKFQIRALMRRFNNLEKVIVVGSFNDERAKKALESFENVMKSAQVNYELVEVDPHNFYDTIITITKKIINNNKGRMFVLNISGGMRILIIELLFAFIFSGLEAEVEIESEDFNTVVSFRLSDMYPAHLTQDHIRILMSIKQGYTSINSIHKRVDMSLSTTWRRLKELREMGLIDEENRLTVKGELVIKMFSP